MKVQDSRLESLAQMIFLEFCWVQQWRTIALIYYNEIEVETKLPINKKWQVIFVLSIQQLLRHVREDILGKCGTFCLRMGWLVWFGV